MKFGYQIIGGKNVVNVSQAEIINKSMLDYLNGTSLMKKAEELTAKGIEYAPGKSQWNKNRVRRMITDTNYLGNENFPKIVEKDLFDRVLSVIDSRNNQKNTNRDEIFSSSLIPIRCANCGTKTYRKYESNYKIPKVFHICENPECNKRYVIYDIDFRRAVREALSETDEKIKSSSNEISREIYRLNNEIERDLQSIEIDENILKNKIFECAALQYSQFTIPKESIDYSQMNLCSLDFNREVKRRIKTIYLKSNDEIWLHMTDGQIVLKEVLNDECSS